MQHISRIQILYCGSCYSNTSVYLCSLFSLGSINVYFELFQHCIEAYGQIVQGLGHHGNNTAALFIKV